MKFISTKGNADPVSFAIAALEGLAPDGGLYMPQKWPQLSPTFLENIHSKTLQDIGFEVSKLLIDDPEGQQLKQIISESLNFDAPLVELDEGLHILELFHGPTLAFKDFGARFMSRVFSALRKDTKQDLIILVATSGDTGSAVAQGFLGVEGVQVCLLYPSGKVSHIQEQQLTTAGKNVTALEVDGTFDDCQRMVKEAFSDSELNDQLMLSSANSINIARLIPQMFYYLGALSQLSQSSAPIFCVPSGNFGNLTAGLMAQKIGMSTSGFIAATNVNDVVPKYLQTGRFDPKPSQRTISNAMDVGNPSNFDRILELYDNDHAKVKEHIWGASFSDSETKRAIAEITEKYDYLVDPHTAVGYLAVEEYQQKMGGHFGENSTDPFVILSTAHPAKFSDVIEPVIKKEVPLPNRLKTCLAKEKESIPMKNDYQKLKDWLLNSY